MARGHTAALATAGNGIVDGASGGLRAAGRNYSSQGVHIVATEEITPELWATIEFSTGTALVLGPAPFRRVRDLENAIASLTPTVRKQRCAVTAWKVAGAGTVWHAAYRWQPAGTLTPVDAFDNPSGDAYLSIYIRQPLCGTSRISKRFLTCAIFWQKDTGQSSARNGHTVFLAQQPRSIRGGLAFTF